MKGGEVVYSLSEEEVRKKLSEIRRVRERGGWYRYGKDGAIRVLTVRYRHRGVPYEISKMVYFSFNHPEDPLKAEIRGRSHYYVLEYVDEHPWNKVHRLLREYRICDEWLWNDTLQLWADNLSEEQQLERLHKVAREDIDFLLDEAVKKLLDRKKELERDIDFLQKLIAEAGCREG